MSTIPPGKNTNIPKDTLNSSGENFYENLFESVKDYAVFSTDLDGKITSWNAGAITMYGYSRQEIYGQDCSILLPSQDLFRKNPMVEINNILKKGKLTKEGYHLKKNGNKFWGTCIAYPLLTSKGEIIGFTRITQSYNSFTTKQKETIKNSREYAKSIIQTAHEAMIVLNPDMTVNAANDAFYQLFRVRKKAVQNYLLHTLFNNEPNSFELSEFLKSVLSNDNLYKNYEMEVSLPTIGRRTLMLNARKLYPFRSQEMILLAIEDITTKKMLDQQKDDFISVASHELKTPVTHIKGLVQILKRQLQFLSVGSPVENSLQLLSYQTERFSRLVNDLLDISRIQTGKMKLYKQEFNLVQLIEEIADSLKVIQPTHKVIIRGSLSQPVEGDVFKISQILSNLLSNAIKYSPESNKIVIKISENRSKNMATIAITDFGMGIAKEEQHELFKRFFRTRAVKEKNIQGIGLGLNITAEIVKQHGGKIWFRSEPGKGSTFYFTLPLNGKIHQINEES